MIILKKFFLKYGEQYFTPSGIREGLDVVRYVQIPAPLCAGHIQTFTTRILYLNQSTDQLFERIHSNCRKEIRRSKQDSITHRFIPSAGVEDVSCFCDFFNRFAKIKHLPPANRPKLVALSNAGLLDLSSATSDMGESLIWHAYIRDNERARLLHTASLYRASHDSAYRNLIGRANRRLLWCEICRYKEAGVLRFDFGGWYTGGTDDAKTRINFFKEQFGGELLQEYTVTLGLSTLGRAAVKCYSLWVRFHQ
jgi:lipid II:glycine glycyltransferase (peptidoglycan interpeptide bridge formation enzyme)